MKTLLGMFLAALSIGLLEAWTVLQERFPAGCQPPAVSVTGPAAAGSGGPCPLRARLQETRPALQTADAEAPAREVSRPRIGGQDWLRSIVRVDL